MSFMRTCFLLALILSFHLPFLKAQSGLIISGVLDGPLPNGTPKVIECYALDNIPDLSLYGIGVTPNGNGTSDEGYTFPDTTLLKGDFIYIATEEVNFNAFLGFPPTFITGEPNINGDDAVQLFFNGEVVDQFGDINLDGTNQAWEYTDGWAYRANGEVANGGAFSVDQWIFSGPEALTGETTNADADEGESFPTASYAIVSVDGVLDPSGVYGSALALANAATSFGNNTDPDSVFASGSELDGIYAAVDQDNLYLFFAGNLESNFNKFEIFIDSEAGGQNQLSSGLPTLAPAPDALRIMGDTLDAQGQGDPLGVGLTFEDDFTADYYFGITGGLETDSTQDGVDSSYNLISTFAPIDVSVATGTFLGGGEGSLQALSNGGIVAINNSNLAGVNDLGVGDPENVNTGIEYSIPLSSIGDPQGPIKVVAFINNGFHNLISNMILEGTGGTENLGDPRLVDFGAVPGTQFVSFCAGVEGGIVTTADGETSISFCSSNLDSSLVSFTSANASGEAFTYIVTDTFNVIVAIPTNDSFDFSTITESFLRVWGVSYSGNFTGQVGDSAATAALSDTCFALSSNFISVEATTVDGGTITTEDGNTSIVVDTATVAFDSTGVIGENFVYVVTDTANAILDVLDSDSTSFTGITESTVRVWGLAYTGTLIAAAGDTASLVALSDDCFDLSDSFVTAILTPAGILGGSVLTESGEDSVITCPGDGIPDIIRVDSFNVVAPNFTYVVTDDQNVILALPTTDSVDLEGAGPGVCRIWGLGYSGNLIAELGDTASVVVLSDDEFALSTNFVTAIRDSVSGGTVTIASGDTLIGVCIDNEDDFITFSSEGAVGLNFTYVITDDENEILAISDTNVIDFNVAGVGICRVWGLSYNGNLIAQEGQNAAEVDLSDNCFDLSDNFVTVLRDNDVDGGELSTPSGDLAFTVCSGDDIPDFISVINDSESLLPYVYVITDTSNVVLAVSESDSIDFEDAGPGICRIWGLSYAGELLATAGDSASVDSLASSCFELSSNFITVDRGNVDGGITTTEDGFSEISICLDGVDDSVSFVSTSTAPDSAFTFIVTDDEGIILGIPPGNTVEFEGAGRGICRVYGVAFLGDLVAVVGDTLGVTALATDCFSISNEFVTVFRDTVEGGSVSLLGGDTEATVCGDDQLSDILTFDNNSSSLVFYDYIVTNENNLIANVLDTDSVDFNNVGTGTFRVWGVSYTGELVALLSQDISTATLSDGCFELSANFVTVTIDTLEGGSVSLIDGTTSANICAGDGFADSLSFSTTSTSGLSYAYVITDDQNNILGLPEGNVADLEGAGAGICRIWGLSFNGNIIAQIGTNAATEVLSDDCFELSENFITVTRDTGDLGFCVTNILEDLGINTFDVYPNPTNSKLFVSFSSERPNETRTTLEVFDVRGRQVLQQTFITAISTDNSFELDVKNLDTGLYLLILNNKGRSVTTRFIKQ